jgi:hypothetical protein
MTKSFAIFALGSLALAAAAPSPCCGHGHPAIVNLVPNSPGGKLTITGGAADADGYANQIFAETDSDLWLLPSGAGFAFTDAPGLDISDVAVGSELFYEIIPRPDLTAPGHPQRWLWQWNLSTEAIAVTGATATLSLNPDQSGLPTVTFGQAAPPSNPLFKLADLASDDIGQHVHYLFYILNDNDLGPDGVYGFFARLVSPGYQSSDPFLIALNLNSLLEKFQLGAKEINAAAGLAGDFDADADVDGADFLLWQGSFGATGPNLHADGSLNQAVDAPDHAIWKSQFGRQVTIPTAIGASAPIPEPTAATLTFTLIAARVLAGIVPMPRRTSP